MASHVIDWDDTVVALATPPGMGAIGVIRVSGKQTFSILNDLFPSKNLLEQASHTIVVGLLKDQNKVLDEVVLSLFKGPKSYTGEDVIEISCHGSAYIQAQIIASITARGARLAKAGEFTQRAFLNGKLDLAQAESVADLIASNSEASKRAAIHTMRGGFSTDLAALREQLITFSALIELELDFSEEDVEFANRAQMKNLILQILKVITRLINSFELGNVIKNGIPVVIAGKPNVGKSTLLNALLNEERAIVSEIAGTTRDTIEDEINIKGMKFRFIDTAGIRDTTDEIESIGIEKTFEKIAQASIVLYLVNPATPQEEIDSIKKSFEEKADSNKRALIFIFNKTDIHSPSVKEADDVMYISAKEKKGIEKVSEKLVAMVNIGQVKIGDVIVSNSRHYDALVRAQESLDTVLKGLQSQLPTDLIAIDIRTAMFELGTITGEVSTDDLLESIFRNFCIGK